MGHLAEIVNNKVVRVIVCDDVKWAEENLGGEWVPTSYNTYGGVYCEPNSRTPAKDQTKALRGNYAGPGFEYNRELDAFIPPKPFESWVLDEKTFNYKPPKKMPKTKKNWVWDESIKNWKEAEVLPESL